MNRSIFLRFDQSAMDTLRTEIRADAPSDFLVRGAVGDAIAYLGMWSMDTKQVCSIAIGDKTDFIALYWNSASNHAAGKRADYTIAAIWNGAAYGFHS